MLEETRTQCPQSSASLKSLELNQQWFLVPLCFHLSDVKKRFANLAWLVWCQEFTCSACDSSDKAQEQLLRGTRADPCPPSPPPWSSPRRPGPGVAAAGQRCGTHPPRAPAAPNPQLAVPLLCLLAPPAAGPPLLESSADSRSSAGAQTPRHCPEPRFSLRWKRFTPQRFSPTCWGSSALTEPGTGRAGQGKALLDWGFGFVASSQCFLWE